MMVTKIQFIMGYSLFLFFLMQISAMAGESIVSGIEAPSVPTSPTTPTQGGFWGFWDGLVNIIGYIFSNIGYFFKLMGASTTFGIFGAVVLTPFVITLVWIILELIRGV
jgi:hypothetical protein